MKNNKIISFIIDLLIVTGIMLVIVFANLITLALVVIILVPTIIYLNKINKHDKEKPKFNFWLVLLKVILVLIILFIILEIKSYIG